MSDISGVQQGGWWRAGGGLVVTRMESSAGKIPGTRSEKWQEPDLHHLVGHCGDLGMYSIDWFEQRRVRPILANLLGTDGCGVCLWRSRENRSETIAE